MAEEMEKLTIPQTIALWAAIILFVLFGFAVLTLLIYLSVEMWRAILN